ncbi:1,6-anhydro-N-acetylmuramyl-L-alanine amidase AmpD [Halorhodospira neutriphila]|uniref:1,6-anhydro-N-acetylmuramyl-L-alanine amidase AmpD n=1 Tax=Halorhodospira neutriphila TaxID=168379 RepID=A0ABS1E7G1_9GAMM|nr:1,6-anhydro-N-acetylmuramyl-L-alanine amidase AmpD [Halorhodospira neutriphila]MBK1726219.1 N-acetylmuramoyl-L-alanine amidase [Halorhodospira neutriphila]
MAHGPAIPEVDTASGRIASARWVPSPNEGPRPPGCGLELIVIHAISLPPGGFGGGWIDRLFTNRLPPDAHPAFREIAALRVSAHALIDREGALTQYVRLHRRAWHAGRSRYAGRSECNDFSVGIELEGDEVTPYTPAQYASLAGLLRALRAAYPGLAQAPVVGHSDIAPARKTDPGPAFDWERLRAAL